MALNTQLHSSEAQVASAVNDGDDLGVLKVPPAQSVSRCVLSLGTRGSQIEVNNRGQCTSGMLIPTFATARARQGLGEPWKGSISKC